MWNLLVDVVLVGPDESRGGDVAVVNPELKALTQQRFGEDDERTLAQIVRARFEAEAKEANAFSSRVEHLLDCLLELALVAHQDRLDHRHLQIKFLGAVL